MITDICFCLFNRVDLFYVLYKGASNFDIEEKIDVAWVVPASFAVGAFFGVLWIFIFGPCAKRRVEAHLVEVNAARDAAIEAKADEKADMEESALTEPQETNVEGSDDNDEAAVGGEDPTEPVEDKPKSWFRKFANSTWDQDLHTQSMHESAKAQEIWDNEEQFDENAEGLFTYIQVFTASLNSFAHGANDVANTIAPMSAIIDIYRSGEVSSEAGVPRWVLAYGGIAIVLGLLLYGYKVMKSLGYKLTMMTPSRGASAELGASLTVVTAAFLGIPVSSTQCIVGAVTAVGLVGGRKSVDLMFLLKICGSWVALFFVAVVFSAGVFSFGAYSPSAMSTAVR
jgi:sodium-dependent phosphate transporter